VKTTKTRTKITKISLVEAERTGTKAQIPDKVKKPKWVKPRKPHGKASARACTGAEAAEIAADRAEQSSKMVGRQPTHEKTLENSGDEEVVVPGTPPEFPGESQGGTTITLAMGTPERLGAGSDLALELP
jgi:hypothetical protein